MELSYSVCVIIHHGFEFIQFEWNFLKTSDCTEKSRKEETCVQIKMNKYFIKTRKISQYLNTFNNLQKTWFEQRAHGHIPNLLLSMISGEVLQTYSWSFFLSGEVLQALLRGMFFISGIIIEGFLQTRFAGHISNGGEGLLPN